MLNISTPQKTNIKFKKNAFYLSIYKYICVCVCVCPLCPAVNFCYAKYHHNNANEKKQHNYKMTNNWKNTHQIFEPGLVQKKNKIVFNNDPLLPTPITAAAACTQQSQFRFDNECYLNLPDNHKRVSQQQLLLQQQPQHLQHSATVLLAEQEAQAIDWSDEKLDLQAAFVKIRAVLASRNASANAVLQALAGSGSTTTASTATDMQSSSTTASGQNVTASTNSATDTNTLASGDGSSMGKITDSISHLPIGSASSIGIYYDLPFFLICFLH